MSERAVIDCWRQAEEEHPHDTEARRKRYVELLKAAGLVEEGPPRALPCGWVPKPPPEAHYPR